MTSWLFTCLQNSGKNGVGSVPTGNIYEQYTLGTFDGMYPLYNCWSIVYY